ncbi:MAG: LexA family transcriptional regulator [Legionella sp.]|nr:LexA family transcriptional regulator [Legionella sp.]
MNIKEKIGQRILQERKTKGLSRKDLGELTDDLNQSRINNYERGDRTPGPQEIKQLAKALDVSPAYLMCLTDDKQSDKPKKIPGLGAILPVLDHKQACDPKQHISNIKNDLITPKLSFIPITSELAARVSGSAFALYMQDDSMAPELKLHDLLIVDPDATPNPGDLVLAKLKDAQSVIVRRYKQLSVANTMEEYELVAINDNWPNINSKTTSINNIIGSIMRFCRDIK